MGLGSFRGFRFSNSLRSFAKVATSANVPFVDGAGESSASYAQEVVLSRRVANLGSARRASAHIADMDKVAREVCMAAGSDQIMDHDGVMETLKVLRDYTAPDSGWSKRKSRTFRKSNAQPKRWMDV